MTQTNEIATIPTKENALAVFSAAQGLDPFLSVIRAEIDGFIPDVSTRKGRDAIASIAHKVARSKTALDNVGKELVAELKDIPKKIDAERKRQADEKAETERQAAARAADTVHKTTIMKAAKEDLMKTGLTEAQAKAVVIAIAKGLIPCVSISF